MKYTNQEASVFNNSSMISCGGKLLDLTTPRIMGILNVTPDSFFDGGKFTHTESILRRAGLYLKQGATLIDIGGQSTRPGARLLSVSTELKRTIPAIRAIRAKYPEALISIDTFYSEVALKAVEAGACMINDVSGGTIDRNMFSIVAKTGVPYILMHMKGTPATMQKNPRYKNVVTEVIESLGTRIRKLRKLGVKDIIVDPGFGFGKTLEQNYALLNALETIQSITGCYTLAGLSRKSMVCKVLHTEPSHALNGTTALNMVALMKGASILRVHDVKEAFETIQLYQQLKSSHLNQ